MNYSIDREKRPVYLQIYRQLLKDIVEENLPYHAKLPSKRNLAEELGVSTVTVEHAYALLCEEGYVQAKERSGFVVIFRKNDGFASSAEGPVEQFGGTAGHSRPDFPLSVLRKTVRKVLSEQGELLLEKSPNNGSLQLRRAIARYLARNRAIQVEPEQIVIGAGAEYLYGLIVELLGRNRIYAIESPSYQQIEQVYKASEVRYESLPLTPSGIDSSALAQSHAQILHTTPYRSYPSGVTATASKRHEYIRWAQQGDRFIIEDDFESEFSLSSKTTETLFSLSGDHNVIYLNSFSKTISPSLRIGYMVLPPCLVDPFRDKLGFYSCTVASFMQCVLAELIDNGDFERHINRVRRNLRKTLAEKNSRQE